MREEIFTESPLSPTGADPWTKHTLHALKSALLLHPVLANCQNEFYDVPDTVGLNILRVKDQDSTFQLHHRLLNFEAVHKERTSCPLYQSHQHRTAPEGEIVCDCAVDELLELLLSEIDEISFKD